MPVLLPVSREGPSLSLFFVYHHFYLPLTSTHHSIPPKTLYRPVHTHKNAPVLPHGYNHAPENQGRFLLCTGGLKAYVHLLFVGYLLHCICDMNR